MAKICTSIEQSKKLIELVIDINTADMCWSTDIPDLPTLLAYPITDCDNWENKTPAWSLTALMGLIPKFSLEKDISKDAGYQLHYNYNTIYYDDPIDAAFEMICWLKEYKKI